MPEPTRFRERSRTITDVSVSSAVKDSPRKICTSVFGVTPIGQLVVFLLISIGPHGVNICIDPFGETTLKMFPSAWIVIYFERRYSAGEDWGEIVRFNPAYHNSATV